MTLETVLYRAHTFLFSSFSLLLVSHGGLTHVCYFKGVSKGQILTNLNISLRTIIINCNNL